MHGKTIQIPLVDLNGKWTYLVVDLKTYIGELYLLKKQSEGTGVRLSNEEFDDLNLDMILKNVELCAKMSVRSCWISDVSYNVHNIPKEHAFLLTKGQSFEDKYNFRHLQNPLFRNSQSTHKREGSNSSKKIHRKSQERLRKVPKRMAGDTNIIHEQSRSPEHHIENPSHHATHRLAPMACDIMDTTGKKNFRENKTTKRRVSFQGLNGPTNDQLHGKPIRQVVTEIHHPIPEICDPEIESHRQSYQPIPVAIPQETLNYVFTQDPETVPDNDYQEKILSRKHRGFQLEPTPIMSLTYLQGTGIGYTCNKVQYVNTNTVMYTSGKNVASSNIYTFHQRFFIGCDSDVTCFAILKDDNLLITSSGQRDSKAEINFWRVMPVGIINVFRTELYNITNISASKFKYEQNQVIYLSIVGRDDMQRDVITIYNITGYQENEFTIFTKQISDFNIKKLYWLDKRDNTTLISCGFENIVIWKIKNKFISNTPLKLNEHAKGTTFHDFDVLKKKINKKETQYYIYFVSSRGF